MICRPTVIYLLQIKEFPLILLSRRYKSRIPGIFFARYENFIPNHSKSSINPFHVRKYLYGSFFNYFFKFNITCQRAEMNKLKKTGDGYNTH